MASSFLRIQHDHVDVTKYNPSTFDLFLPGFPVLLSKQTFLVGFSYLFPGRCCSCRLGQAGVCWEAWGWQVGAVAGG